MQTPSTEERKVKEKLEKYRVALKAIASIQDCLFKSDATVMREIAREALK